MIVNYQPEKIHGNILARLGISGLTWFNGNVQGFVQNCFLCKNCANQEGFVFFDS